MPKELEEVLNAMETDPNIIFMEFGYKVIQIFKHIFRQYGELQNHNRIIAVKIFYDLILL